MYSRVGQRGRRRSYTDQDLRNILQNAAKYFGKDSLSWLDYLKFREDADDELPVPQTFAARFGTWYAAVVEAGLRPVVEAKDDEKYSIAEMIECMQSAAKVNKSTSLTIADYEKWASAIRNGFGIDVPSSRWIIISFKTWLNAVAEAGLVLRDTQHAAIYSDENMLRSIREAATARNSKTISIKSYEEFRDGRKDVPGARTIATRFGTWGKGVAAAGLTPIKAGFQHRYTEGTT